MAIGIQGNYLFQFSLGGKKDFIEERDFVSFNMVEEAGNVLPTFSLAFNTTDDSVLSLLNEGNKLQVTYGKDRNSLIDTPLHVTGIDSDKSGSGKRLVICTGIYGAKSYITNNKLSITESMSGVAAVKSIVSKYFKYHKDNIDVSQDSQRWVQYNISDRAFVNKIWLHSHIDGSFIATGITSAGEFIIKDMKKDISRPYKWRFTKSVQDENRDIVIDGDPHIKIQSGLINSWVGYGREKMVYDIETAENIPTMTKQEPIIAMTNKLARDADIQKRFAAAGVKNENVHTNYWDAYLRNLTNLASFHNVAVTVSFHNIFKEIRVLDQSMFKEDSVSTPGATSDILSGIYYVTKVSRVLQESQFVTMVVINRESVNQVKTGLA